MHTSLFWEFFVRFAQSKDWKAKYLKSAWEQVNLTTSTGISKMGEGDPVPQVSVAKVIYLLCYHAYSTSNIHDIIRILFSVKYQCIAISISL